MKELERAISAAAEAVVAAAEELNRLDAQAGDGDLGVTMALAGRTVLGLLPTLVERKPHEVLRACGAAIAQKAPSTAGTLVATGLLRAGKVLAESESMSTQEAFASALSAAAAGIAERGKAALGSKTMLDSLGPAAQAAARAAEAGDSREGVVTSASVAAEEGARSTAAMRARHGRAGWLAERSAGHEDAGARMVAIVLRAVAASVAMTEGKV